MIPSKVDALVERKDKPKRREFFRNMGVYEVHFDEENINDYAEKIALLRNKHLRESLKLTAKKLI